MPLTEDQCKAIIALWYEGWSANRARSSPALLGPCKTRNLCLYDTKVAAWGGEPHSAAHVTSTRGSRAGRWPQA